MLLQPRKIRNDNSAQKVATKEELVSDSQTASIYFAPGEEENILENDKKVAYLAWTCIISHLALGSEDYIHPVKENGQENWVFAIEGNIWDAETSVFPRGSILGNIKDTDAKVLAYPPRINILDEENFIVDWMGTKVNKIYWEARVDQEALFDNEVKELFYINRILYDDVVITNVPLVGDVAIQVSVRKNSPALP